MRIFLFESSTHVLWAEEVALEEKVPVEVIPAPKGGGNHCGLALRTLAGNAPALATLLENEGIPFEAYENP